MTVLSFPKTGPEQPDDDDEPLVRVCAHCSNQTFILYDNDLTECALCHYVSRAEGGWVERAETAVDFKEPPATRNVTPYATVDLAREAVVRGVDADTAVLAVIWPDGRIRAWAGIADDSSPKRKRWMYTALRRAGDLITGAPSKRLNEMPDE